MTSGERALKGIVEDLNDSLSRCGLMYHIFYRAKSATSIEKKMKTKADDYRAKGKKMQDFLGLRITLYFSDDVEIIHNHLKMQSNYLDESFDEDEIDRFCPKRLNLIMRVPEKHSQFMKDEIKTSPYYDLIDDTYEIQIRTILSEGWHEVEHDLRYKCKEDWDGFKEESRLLNGIFASLESNEWSMLRLFDRLAYSHYKSHNWDSMMRNKMRIRFHSNSLSSEVGEWLNNNPDIAKQIFRTSRSKIIQSLLCNEFYNPLTYDTVLHLINHLEVKNNELARFEDPILKEELNRAFGIIN